jgi:hypothetical protein
MPPGNQESVTASVRHDMALFVARNQSGNTAKISSEAAAISGFIDIRKA